MKFLKSLPANRRAYNDFEWPAEAGAIVEAPDWNPKPACGGGLHGLVDGRGDVGLLCKDADAIWYAFESVSSAGEPSDAEAVVINGDKGKCRRAMIRVVGTREAAVQWLVAKGCTGVHFSTATAGDRGTATAGYGGTATAGMGGTLILCRWDEKRYKYSVAEVGENGIKPGIAYRLNADGLFVEAMNLLG